MNSFESYSIIIGQQAENWTFETMDKVKPTKHRTDESIHAHTESYAYGVYADSNALEKKKSELSEAHKKHHVRKIFKKLAKQTKELNNDKSVFEASDSINRL